jgi:hypothetical protein
MEQMTDDDIKQIFFYCDKHEPNAIIADEVDIIQFARRIEAFLKKSPDEPGEVTTGRP